MSLSVKTLSCQRQGRLIQQHISFDLSPGQALVLRGPNGIGKSTLLRCLAGLLPPVEGDAVLNGHSLMQAPSEYTMGIAFSGHLDAVRSQLSVLENLGFWAAIHGTDLGEVLDLYMLTPLKDRPAGRLSAGQKRRLGLARLELTGAPLWLMDEPTQSLDDTQTERITARITAHLGGGGMAVISTHQPLDLPDCSILPLEPPQTTASQDPFLAAFS